MKSFFTFLLAGLTSFVLVTSIAYAQTASSNCVVTRIGNPAGQALLPLNCTNAGTISGNAQDLAKQILTNSKIVLNGPAKQDIQATANGQSIQNSDSCGNSVSLNAALLKLMLQIAQKHTYEIGYIITAHGCDPFLHGKGRAMDLWTADGQHAWQNTQFRQDVASMLPSGGGLAQQGCPGAANVTGNNIRQFPDSCNHQHVDVGATAQ